MTPLDHFNCITPLGPAICVGILDEGNAIEWVTFIKATGEPWFWRNPQFRIAPDITAGRSFISPFSEPHPGLAKQIKRYKDNNCQLDHAKTIAEGRIIQLEQVAHWLATEHAAAPVPPAEETTETRLVTDEDREYASELLADLTSDDLPRLEIAARWFRKARVERAIPSGTGAAEPECGWANKVAMLEAALDDLMKSFLFWKRLANNARDIIKPFAEQDADSTPAIVLGLREPICAARAFLSLLVQPGAGEREHCPVCHCAVCMCFLKPPQSSSEGEAFAPAERGDEV